MNTYQTEFNPFARNIAIVKSYFKKPAILTQGILYIVLAILNIVTVLITTPSINKFVNSIFSLPEVIADTPAQELDFLTSFMDIYINSVMYISLILSVALTILIATAYFLIYFKSKNENPLSTPSVGINILYVLAIIQLIPIIMLTLVLTLFIIMMFAIAFIPDLSSGAETSNAPFAVMAVIYTIVFGGMCAVLLLFFINQVRYYKSVKTSLTSVNLTYKGAGIYGVFSMIYGIYTAFNALSSFAITPVFKAIAEIEPEFAVITDMFGALTPAIILSSVVSILSGVIYIIDAVIALGYKKYIKSFTDGFGNTSTPQPEGVYSAPAYDAPQTQPQSQPQQLEQPQFQPVVFHDNKTNAQPSACPRCGTIAKDSDIFCNACGTKIN